MGGMKKMLADDIAFGPHGSAINVRRATNGVKRMALGSSGFRGKRTE